MSRRKRFSPITLVGDLLKVVRDTEKFLDRQNSGRHAAQGEDRELTGAIRKLRRVRKRTIEQLETYYS